MSRIRHATETFVNHLIDGVKKLISSNTEQINVLSGKALKYMGELDPVVSLYINEAGIYGLKGDYTNAPKNELFGEMKVTKNNAGVVTRTLIANNLNNHPRVFVSKFDTAESGWTELATTVKTDILVTPTNGLKVTGNNVSFVEEIAGIKIYHGELEAAAPISDNPIVLTLPKFTSNTWRPVTFVKQDTKEAYGGWCYHGGQVRASLPAGKYNIDIIYT